MLPTHRLLADPSPRAAEPRGPEGQPWAGQVSVDTGFWVALQQLVWYLRARHLPGKHQEQVNRAAISSVINSSVHRLIDLHIVCLVELQGFFLSGRVP